MKSVFRLFVLVLLVGGWSLAALSLHVVRTPDQQMPVTMVTKDRMGIHDIYVDTTKWTIDDVGRHPYVVERLINSGKADILKHVVDPKGGDVAQQLTDALDRGTRNAANTPSTSPTEQLARHGIRWPWEK